MARGRKGAAGRRSPAAKAHGSRTQQRLQTLPRPRSRPSTRSAPAGTRGAPAPRRRVDERSVPGARTRRRLRHAALGLAFTVPGVTALVLGHRLLGVGLLLVVAVPMWARATLHELRGLAGEIRPGESVRLHDGTITPVQAVRMENFDAAMTDLGISDGGGGGGDGGGGGS